MMSAGVGLREGETLTEPPRAGRRRCDLDVGEHALDHGRGVDDALELLVVAHRVGGHVLVRAARDLDLVVDSDDFRFVLEPSQVCLRGGRVPWSVNLARIRRCNP